MKTEMKLSSKVKIFNQFLRETGMESKSSIQEVWNMLGAMPNTKGQQ